MERFLRRTLLAIAVGATACTHAGSPDAGIEPPAARACNPPTTLETLKTGSIGAKWNRATGTLAYGRPNASGTYAIYLADREGKNERPLTYAGWRADRHQWAEEWHPSGKYIFALVEKAEYAPEPSHTRAPVDALPGYGAYTDLWLMTPDGQKAWQLTNLPNDYDHGITHAAISADGSRFAWTERIQRPNFFDLVYMTGVQADIFPFEIQGADWWIMGTDGSDQRRLTYMNKAGHPQSVGHYRLAGTLSFIDDRSFYGDVMTQPLGLVGTIVKVSCQ